MTVCARAFLCGSRVAHTSYSWYRGHTANDTVCVRASGSAPVSCYAWPLNLSFFRSPAKGLWRCDGPQEEGTHRVRVSLPLGGSKEVSNEMHQGQHNCMLKRGYINSADGAALCVCPSCLLNPSKASSCKDLTTNWVACLKPVVYMWCGRG